MGSIRVSAVQKASQGWKGVCHPQTHGADLSSHLQNHTPTTQAVPAALLPPALSLAVEEGFLRMGETAPATDTDHFDKEALNSEQLQMMAEERLARKLYVPTRCIGFDVLWTG
jgi:hypothetical protein